ncbi:hypothetical protein B0T26DRAFT_709965 [Lasiosphaeria miniovina]|uniref:Uncharacterized protein n=1 Tax=Lasiosphaeria miniovina TaxID=1954250 RepID=A0AA40AKD7_9PEZI|nr:uncharacterized protein B0T26DRAFT_709965 [Lasiosphaeria miniovina]KAK0717461.1 hypothetical protein B0T26DRAFT_709965 [Lasiosphaeria miniovina]
MPSIPEAGNTLSIPTYTAEAEKAVQDLSWSQSFQTKTGRYYIVKAKNVTKAGDDVLLYVQDRFYKDEASADYIGKLPGARKEGGHFIVTINDRFQYGQKNKEGENRWVALHDKNNKPYQHRFIVLTIQGKAADWAKTLAKTFGASELAETVSRLGSSFVGDYLHTF